MSAPSHLIFVTSGGMGSTHLVHSIRATGTPCVEKPDANTWYPWAWPEEGRIDESKPAVASLEEHPTPTICRRFLDAQDELSDAGERFELDPAKSLGANLVDYFAFLQSRGIACVLRGTSLEGLIGKARVRGAVFLIRDPIQSYASYAKPERHAETFARLGGPESDAAIDFWCWSWNSLADEYLRALDAGADPVLIRYESVSEDVARAGSPFLADVFATFRPRSNDIDLPDRGVQRFRELTGDRYELIYGAAPAF